MDYSSQTVAKLRSLLNSDGFVVPQAYMKKAELVEMCEKHFGKQEPVARMSTSSNATSVRSRNSTARSVSSEVRSALKTGAVVARPPSASFRRKSSIGTRTKRPPSPAKPVATPPKRSPAKLADDSDSGGFKRTPSPEPGKARKPFGGRPSLTPSQTPKKISIAPMSTLPPRPKSFGRKPEPSSPLWKSSLVPGLFGLLAVGVALHFVTRSGAPRTPLCNTNGTPHVANTTCVLCPRLGTCANGYITACAEHYIVHGDQCVRDEAKFVNAVAMTDSIANRLVTLKGMKDCGEDVSDTVFPEQLKLQLRMEFKQLSDEQFRAAFDLAVNGEKEGVLVPSYIQTTPLGLMRSSYGRKSLSCRAREFVYDWWLTILLTLVTISYAWAKIMAFRRKRHMTRSLVSAIESNTKLLEGRIQGLSVLDLRDFGMPLHQMDDKPARKTMNLLLKSYPDIQCGEDISRAGEIVYWSSHRVRAEQAAFNKSRLSHSNRPSVGGSDSGDNSPRRRELSN